MEQTRHDKVNAEVTRDNGNHDRPVQSPAQVQLVFVATLIFIVLSVVAEYLVGEFAGRNIGGDFSVILGGALAFGIAVGLAVSAVRHWNHHPHGH
jgi:hypothetical protein